MSFTAPVLPIGEGLASGIMSGSDSLNKAIGYVSEQYKNAKAAQGLMATLATQKDASGNPMIPQNVMDMFNKQNPQAQTAIAGLLSNKAVGQWNAQNQQLLQQSQGNVETGVHEANTKADYSIAAQHGVVPNRKPDELPAGIGRNGNGNGGSNLVPAPNSQNTGPATNTPTASSAPGLPSHIPMAPQVPVRTLNGQNYAVQHADPNDPNSPITHIFDSGSGKWVAVGGGSQ
jgi:hypothetical protein